MHTSVHYFEKFKDTFSQTNNFPQIDKFFVQFIEIMKFKIWRVTFLGSFFTKKLWIDFWFSGNNEMETLNAH